MNQSSKEPIMKIRVACQESFRLEGATKDIVMIPFTGEAVGPLFRGHVIGTGVDTQKIGKDGKMVLSARYMMEGTDCEGKPCRVFVENQGSFGVGFVPTVVTDSAALAELETAALIATVEGAPGGVIVRIMRKEQHS